MRSFFLALSVFFFSYTIENKWMPEIKFKKLVTVTGYSSRKCETDDTPFITASNKRVRDGFVACNFLKFGTKIRIPEFFGDKVFVVQDRMHRRKKHNVDIWFGSTNQAIHFGKKKALIEVLHE